jgi:hypothetical protein
MSTLTSPEQDRWWGSKVVTVLALAAQGTSMLFDADGWKSVGSALLALAFALVSADAILGWMKTAPAKIGALTVTTVGSAAICFAPRVPALIALLAVCGFWVVAFVKTPKRA